MGWISPWAIYDEPTQSFVMKDNRVGTQAPAWTFPNRTGEVIIGNSEGGIDFAGTYADHIIDFSNATQAAGDISLIRAGSYSAPLDVAGEAQYGMLRFYLGTDDDGTSYNRGIFVCLKTSGTKGIFPIAGLAEVLAQSGAGPNKVMPAQFIAMLQESGAKLATMGGDLTAGMYAAWLKVGSILGSEASAGSRVASVWLDSTMSGAVAGESYSAFISNGGRAIDAVFGFEIMAAFAWDQLFYFDETCYNKDPISNYSLKVLLDTTQYYLPLSTIAGGMGFSGTFAGHVLDFSNITQAAGDISLIRAGSYSAPMDAAGEAQYGMLRFYLSTDDNGTSYNRGLFVCLKTEGTKGIFPIAGLAEVLAQSGAGPNKAMAGQFIAMLQESGSKLATMGGDTTAGMYAAWLKVGAVSGATASSGSRIAAVWLDNSLYSTNIHADCEHYSAFISNGGVKADAVFAFETGSNAGWSYLFDFDETAYDEDPVAAGNITGGDKDYNFKCLLNGVPYGIQLYKL